MFLFNLLSARILTALLAGILAFLLSACDAKRFFTDQPVRQTPKTSKQTPQNLPPPDFKILTIKSPIFTYYDYALVRKANDSIIIELFRLGNNFGNITISKNQICFMNDCSPKWVAAKRFFGKVAYRDMFDDIIQGRDIFKGRGKMAGPNHTLIQRFQEGGEILFYERRQGHILFRNLSNGFMLVLDDYIDPAKQYDTMEDDE